MGDGRCLLGAGEGNKAKEAMGDRQQQESVMGGHLVKALSSGGGCLMVCMAGDWGWRGTEQEGGADWQGMEEEVRGKSQGGGWAREGTCDQSLTATTTRERERALRHRGLHSVVMAGVAGWRGRTKRPYKKAEQGREGHRQELECWSMLMPIALVDKKREK